MDVELEQRDSANGMQNDKDLKYKRVIKEEGMCKCEVGMMMSVINAMVSTKEMVRRENGLGSSQLRIIILQKDAISQKRKGDGKRLDVL